MAASQCNQTGTFTYGDGFAFTVNYFPSLNLSLISQVRSCIDVSEIRSVDKFILSFKFIFKWMFIIHYFYDYKKNFFKPEVNKRKPPAFLWLLYLECLHCLNDHSAVNPGILL